VDAPPVRYVTRDGARLAYQVVADGESNLVWLTTRRCSVSQSRHHVPILSPRRQSAEINPRVRPAIAWQATADSIRTNESNLKIVHHAPDAKIPVSWPGRA
jgi:hypothetical protein